MSNAKQILRHGYGYPRFWLYNKLGEEVVIADVYNSVPDIPIASFITDFEYTFDEENDDECKISFQFLIPSQIDHEIFQEDIVLRVQWGYILPDGEIIKANIRTVAIRDIAPSYSENGIKLVLSCTDLVSYLKNVRGNFASDSNNFVDWLQEILNDEYKATVTVAGEVIAMTQTEARPFKYDENGVLFASDNARSLKSNFLRTKESIVGGKGKALKAEILEKLTGSKAGPAYLDGRDDTINIVVRNFNQKPTLEFNAYGSHHEVISFKAKSNLVKIKEDGGETSTVNPETKKVETTQVGMTPTLVDDTIITEEQVGQVFNKLTEAWQLSIDNPTDAPVVDNFIFTKKIQTGIMGSQDNLDGNTAVETGVRVGTLKWKVRTKSIINLPGFQKLIKEQTLKDYILKKIERKFECTMEVIGDPSIRTSTMFNVEGLSKRDNGKWYITKVEHKLDLKRGYVCTISGIKKPTFLGTQYISKETKYVNSQEELQAISKTEVTSDRNNKEFDTESKEFDKTLDVKKLIKGAGEAGDKELLESYSSINSRLLKDDINKTTLFRFNSEERINKSIIGNKNNTENV